MSHKITQQGLCVFLLSPAGGALSAAAAIVDGAVADRETSAAYSVAAAQVAET